MGQLRSLCRTHHSLKGQVEHTLSRLESAPLSGVRIPGLVDVFKIRMAAEGRGKRGGFRIIYYHCAPLVAPLMIYSKADRASVPNQAVLMALERSGLLGR